MLAADSATGLTGWIVANHLGDWGSVLGVLIALVGFGITIYNVVRSKRSADRAETAATQALQSVRHIDTVQNLSKAISIMAEMQRLNRAKEWKVLLDRHLDFRSVLIEARGAADDLEDSQLARIQAGIAHSMSMSDKIENALGPETRWRAMPQGEGPRLRPVGPQKRQAGSSSLGQDSVDWKPRRLLRPVRSSIRET